MKRIASYQFNDFMLAVITNWYRYKTKIKSTQSRAAGMHSLTKMRFTCMWFKFTALYTAVGSGLEWDRG